MKEKIYSVKEIKNHFGVSRQSVWNWIRSGNLKAFKFGLKEWRIKESELKKFIENKKS